MEEIWKDVEGYEGRYQVSNFGNVRRLLLNGTYKIMKGTSTNDYRFVVLSKNGKGKTFGVHRLVAFAFVPGYFKGAIVNHINCNGFDNRPQNLEWCTYSYNKKYSVAVVYDKKFRNVELFKYLGKRIAELRMERGWSQEKLAEISKLGYAKIQQTEQGTGYLHISVLERLANVFGKRIGLVD